MRTVWLIGRWTGTGWDVREIANHRGVERPGSSPAS